VATGINIKKLIRITTYGRDPIVILYTKNMNLVTYFALGLDCVFPIVQSLSVALIREDRVLYLREAATTGNLEMAEICVSAMHGPFDIIMYLAAENGHIPIMNLMIKAGANAWNTSLRRASMRGQLEMVKFLLSHNKPPGRWDIRSAIAGAIKGKHTDVFEFLRKKL
jgi:hypothetical protein